MKLATFETITEILPIEGADRIEIARIQGWQSVIKKGEYKVGDRVIFIPIDTVMKPDVWNKFFWDKNDPTKPIRVKTVRLKGVVSQGLIFPSSLISAQEIWDHCCDPSEDVSVAGILGVTKYEKPIPAQLAGKVKGDFPSHLLSKTDEDNLMSNISVLEELKRAPYVHATLKMDGTSATYIKDVDGTFRVCSRNLELLDTEENVHWKIAKKYDLENKLRPGTCIQGEICGPGIQGNPASLEELSFFRFNFKDLVKKEYRNCYFRGTDPLLTSIPLVPDVKVWSKEEFADMTIEKLQEFTNKLTYKNNNKPAEGIVLRGVLECDELMYSRVLQKMLSVKIINQLYKD